MKKMNKRYVIGTAFALGAAASLTGCCLPHPNVYGPAPFIQIENGEEPTSGIPFNLPNLSDIFDSIHEIQEAVYGPPEYFEPETEVQEDVYGPPDFFEPETEVQEDVYGPPEFFNGEDW